MYCSGCGKEIDDKNKFCPYCGTAVVNSGNAAVSAGNSINTFKPSGTVPVQKREKKERKKIHVNKALLISLAEVLILAALIIGFFKLGNHVFGPARAAEDYMEAYAEDDWDRIEALTDMKESDFLTRETLKKSLTETLSGDYEDYEAILTSSRGSSAEVKVRYGDEGSLKNKINLTLEKQGEKKFLFFDTWKVSTEGYVVSNPVIYVPTGTKAYLDGAMIPENYLQEGYMPNADYSYGSDSYYDAYVLPEVFIGEHTAAAVIDTYPLASVKTVLNEENKEIVINNLQCPEDLQEKMIRETYESIKQYVGAHVEGKPFSTIEGIYKQDRDLMESAKSNYEYASNNFFAYNKESGVKEVNVRSSHGQVNGFYLNEGSITAEIQYDFEYDTIRADKDWWSGELTENENERSDRGYVYVAYAPDGSWKITSMQLPYEF